MISLTNIRSTELKKQKTFTYMFIKIAHGLGATGFHLEITGDSQTTSSSKLEKPAIDKCHILK